MIFKTDASCLTFWPQKEEYADGDDQKGLNDDQNLVGQEKGDQNAEPKGKYGNADDLAECKSFHTNLLLLSLQYMRHTGKHDKRKAQTVQEGCLRKMLFDVKEKDERATRTRFFLCSRLP